MSARDAFIAEDTPLNLSEKAIRLNWATMSFLFAINHGVVTTSFVFATSILTESVSYNGLAVYYTSTCLGALFLAVPIAATLGPRGGMTIGMLLSALYMGSLALAMIAPQVAWLYIITSVFGGLGTSLMWPAQGKYLSVSARALADVQGREPEAASAQLATIFAFLFLTLEVAFKVGVSAAGANSLVFVACCGCAFVSALLMRMMVHDTSRDQEVRWSADRVVAAVQMWAEPRIWVLSLTNFAFGFSAAFMNGYVNANYTKDQLGTDYVGYFSALTVLVAAGASLVPGAITRPGREAIVRTCAVVVGSVAFVALASLALFANIADWGYLLVLLYVLQGLGRAMYESTNKAVFADFFPGLLAPSAFANVTMQNSLAFTFCFFLSPIIGGTALASIALALSACIVPMYLVAVKLGPLRQGC